MDSRALAASYSIRYDFVHDRPQQLLFLLGGEQTLLPHVRNVRSHILQGRHKVRGNCPRRRAGRVCCLAIFLGLQFTQRKFPTLFQFGRDQSVVGIGLFVLPFSEPCLIPQASQLLTP